MTAQVTRAAAPLLVAADLVFGIPDLVRVGPITLDVRPGEAVGVVGESGAGKSLLCRALTGTLPYHGGRIESGSLRFGDTELAASGRSAWAATRRSGIGFVPQASLSGLNPVRRVAAHFREILVDERPPGGWRARAVQLLEDVRLREPERVLRSYGHQLSGGMQQRVVLALALAARPQLLIADEPTTALDPTVASQILDVLAELRDRRGLALIVVSHDLSVVRGFCDRTHVMYAGRFVESRSTAALFAAPEHPYTVGLIETDPSSVPFGQALRPIPGEPPRPNEWAASGGRDDPRFASFRDRTTPSGDPR